MKQGSPRTGKPGKIGRHFPLIKFYTDWKKSGKSTQIAEKVRGESPVKSSISCSNVEDKFYSIVNQWI